MGNIQIVRMGLGAILGICLLVASIASAVTPISQSYLAENVLTEGTIVSLKENSTDEVEPSNSKNVDNIFGIVVNADNSLLTISTKDATQVQVATEGTQSVLVSDINGDIKRGDHLTASPINGVAMKATGNVRIVGIAQGDMRNQRKETIKGVDGKDEQIMLGEVPAIAGRRRASDARQEPIGALTPRTVERVRRQDGVQVGGGERAREQPQDALRRHGIPVLVE